MNVALVVVTDGRWEYLDRCLASLQEEAEYPFGDRVLVDDSGEGCWSQAGYPNFNNWRCSDEREGLAASVRNGWLEVSPDTDYIFHVEEDFVFISPVPLDDMIGVLERNTYLSQMVLMRQPWGPEEEAAGGFAKLYESEYVEVECQPFIHWMETRRIFSLNPCLIPRRTFERGWPDGNEAGFTAMLNEDPEIQHGIWGQRDDPPMVTHIGERRSQGWKL